MIVALDCSLVASTDAELSILEVLSAFLTVKALHAIRFVDDHAVYIKSIIQGQTAFTWFR